LSPTDPDAPAARADRATLSRDLADFLIELSIALNKHGMYPEGHPSLAPAAGRVLDRVVPLLMERDVLSLGVARTQLVIEGVATDSANPVLKELAYKLHRHHLGAVTFRSGVSTEEIRDVLKQVAVEPDRSGDPLGLGSPERLTQWTHIVLHPMSYGRLELLGEEGEEEPEEMRLSNRRVRASQLWVGLAQAAMAAEEAGEVHASEAEIEHDPAIVARTINARTRTAAYDQVIVGYMLQIAEELRTGEGREAFELKKRMSKLVDGLDGNTLQSLLTMGGDNVQRRKFLLNASEGMAADAVLELVKAAGESEEQGVSHSLLRVLQKLAKHARTGEGRRQTEADVALREQVVGLIRNWSLKDPNPEAYRLALSRMAKSGSVFTTAPDQRFAAEPKRMVQMALEAGVMGEAVGQAVDLLVENGELKWVLETVATSAAHDVTSAIRMRVATPAIIGSIVRAETVEVDLLDLLLPHAPPEVVETLLDELTESDSSRTRSILLERLPSLGREVGSRASLRLRDPRWYVRRNMIKVIGDLGELPEELGASEWLKDPEPRVRLEALRILLDHAETRERAISYAMGDTDDRVAIMGLRTALTDCPAGAIPRIAAAAVSDRSAEIRAVAVQVLGASGSPVALKALLELTAPRRRFLRTKLPPKTPVYLAALRALRGYPDDVAAHRVLETAAASSDPEIARAAAEPSARDQ
jgi:hypothetical protein